MLCWTFKTIYWHADKFPFQSELNVLSLCCVSPAKMGKLPKIDDPTWPNLSTLWYLKKHRKASSPVVTSLMSSAALWQPSTSRWVQADRSLAESTLNTWVSTPCFVPVRRPNERSESRRGELFPGPEWTNLTGEGFGWMRVIKIKHYTPKQQCASAFVWEVKNSTWKVLVRLKRGKNMTHRFWFHSCFPKECGISG